MSLINGTCPSVWKSAKITPVYMKGVASHAGNYRPISILPAMGRLFERILADNVNYHLYRSHLNTDAQYGFVKRRSTELLLLNSSSLWVKAIDTKRFVDTTFLKRLTRCLILNYYTNYQSMEYAATFCNGSPVSYAIANNESK